MHPVPHQATWKHLDGITFADPTYGQPGRIDALLGVQVYAEIIRRGVWTGPRVVLETTFGWILYGTVKERRSPEQSCQPDNITLQDEIKHFAGFRPFSAPFCRTPLNLNVLGGFNKTMLTLLHVHLNH